MARIPRASRQATPFTFPGQIPIDPATGEFAGQDIKTQTRQSLTNISNILAAAGASMADVVKTTVLLNDIADFAAMNEVYAEFFTEPYPARAAFQAAGIPKGALVEIECVAVKLITNPKRQNAPLRKKTVGNLRFCIDNSVCVCGIVFEVKKQRPAVCRRSPCGPKGSGSYKDHAMIACQLRIQAAAFRGSRFFISIFQDL